MTASMMPRLRALAVIGETAEITRPAIDYP